MGGYHYFRKRFSKAESGSFITRGLQREKNKIRNEERLCVIVGAIAGSGWGGRRQEVTKNLTKM
jgi:hypothetical protein